jgi:hypothetical protein
MATTRLNLSPLPDRCGKKRFYGDEEARAEILRLQRRDRDNGKWPRPMSVYWCDQCKANHVGRTP